MWGELTLRCIVQGNLLTKTIAYFGTDNYLSFNGTEGTLVRLKKNVNFLNFPHLKTSKKDIE